MTQSRNIRRQYSPAINQQIVELQQQGVPRLVIAEQLQVPLTKVHKALRLAGTVLTSEQRSKNLTESRKKTMPDYAPDLAEKVLALREEGVKTRLIAERLGVSVSKVLFEIRNANHHFSPEQRRQAHFLYDPKLRQQALDLYRKEKKGVVEIGRILGIKAGTISYWLKDQGEIMESRNPELLNGRKPYYGNYKTGAVNRGLTFTITQEEFENMIGQKCHYCQSPPPCGIDRKDNEKGYESENCLPCCKTCNRAKFTLSYDDFQAWLENLRKSNV